MLYDYIPYNIHCKWQPGLTGRPRRLKDTFICNYFVYPRNCKQIKQYDHNTKDFKLIYSIGFEDKTIEC